MEPLKIKKIQEVLDKHCFTIYELHESYDSYYKARINITNNIWADLFDVVDLWSETSDLENIEFRTNLNKFVGFKYLRMDASPDDGGVYRIILVVDGKELI